jgi:uncharacterized coiled-coil DUF342 family protein
MALTDIQEIIRSLGEMKSAMSAALASLQAKVDGISRRLDASNERVTSHDEAIQLLRIRESQIMSELGQLRRERDSRRIEARQLRNAVVERFLWLLGAILLAMVVHFMDL